jgi:type III secretion protein R
MFNLPDPAVLIPFLFALSLAPVAAVMVTCYTKIVVVMSLLRNALGLQQVPPGMVTNGLALVLTWYVMYPVGIEVAKVVEAQSQSQPSKGGQQMSLVDMVSKGKEPLREFLLKHAHPTEQAFFMDSARRMMKPEVYAQIKPSDFVVLVPAFTVSELTEAFLVGFLIFLPFLAIDLIVSNVLLALGMQMMSPTVVSLPIKLLLFVVLDGWSRLTHSLVLSYA